MVVLLAMTLLALNLRPFVTGLGVVIDDVERDLPLGPGTVGFLTALPPLAFAAAGLLGPRLVRSLGLRACAVGATLLVGGALVLRSMASDAWLFLLAAALVPCGAAVGNVILPAVAKAYFPDRVATVGSAGTAMIVVGGAAGAALTVPLAEATGSWRVAIGAWAVLGVLAAVAWMFVPAPRGPVALPDATAGTGWGDVARSPVAWILAAFFAVQSAGAYVLMGWLAVLFQDAGISAAAAGGYVATWSAMGVPVGMALPFVLGRWGVTVHVPYVLAVLSVAGWLGLGLAPDTLPWLSCIVLGAGGAAFGWSLVMVAERAVSVEDTALLSGFVQSLGYLLAATGPLLFRLGHDLTGDWTVPTLVMAGVAALLAPLGAAAVRAKPFSRA